MPKDKFLPRSYLVQYWDDASGKLVRTESVQDVWVRVGRWDLPQQHTVTAAGENGFTVRTFVLSKHKLAGEAGK